MKKIYGYVMRFQANQLMESARNQAFSPGKSIRNTAFSSTSSSTVSTSANSKIVSQFVKPTELFCNNPFHMITIRKRAYQLVDKLWITLAVCIQSSTLHSRLNPVDVSFQFFISQSLPAAIHHVSIWPVHWWRHFPHIIMSVTLLVMTTSNWCVQWI